MEYNLENFIKINSNVNKDVDKIVLEFIYNFVYSKKDSKTIRELFRSGYCYYFAEILKLAFNRGTVCWAAPFGHIVWLDTNNIPYDIEGMNDSDCDHYIPISYIKEGLDDFKHIPNKSFNASSEYIQDAISRYVEDNKRRD